MDEIEEATATEQKVPQTMLDLPALTEIASRRASVYSQKVHDEFVIAMGKICHETTSITGTEFVEMSDPKVHKRQTMAVLCLAGLSHEKSVALYSETLTEFADQTAGLTTSIKSMSVPFLDSLTMSLKAIHHHPSSAARFLTHYVAPANEERDGWTWQLVENGGNKHFHQSARIFLQGALLATLFFDLKTEQEQQDYVMLDCVKGDAQRTWEWLQDYVDELDIAIPRADCAIDVHSPGGFEALLGITQAHRVAWNKSVIPNYGSYNMDSPSAGRTAYFGKVAGSKGGKTGTFTVRIYDKGIQLLQVYGADAVADLTQEEIQNFSRIECSIAPASPDAKKALARNMAEDVSAVWGCKLFTAELFEKVQGAAVARVKASQKPQKSLDEKKAWLLTQYSKMLKTFYDGESILQVIYDFHEYADVRLDTYGLSDKLHAPAKTDSRRIEYEEFLEHIGQSASASDSEVCSKIRSRGMLKQQELNSRLCDPNVPSRGQTMPPVPITAEEADRDAQMLSGLIQDATDALLKGAALEFMKLSRDITLIDPEHTTISIPEALISEINVSMTLDQYESMVTNLDRFLDPADVHRLMELAFHAACDGDFIEFLLTDTGGVDASHL
jgi:hypothetical protein